MNTNNVKPLNILLLNLFNSKVVKYNSLYYLLVKNKKIILNKQN